MDTTRKLAAAVALAAALLLNGCMVTYTRSAAGDIMFNGSVALPLPEREEASK